MEGLKHDADIAAPEARQRVLVQRDEIDAADRHASGVGPLQPRHHHQQRRFAGTGRADEANCLASAYIQVDVFEDMNARRALAERQIDAGQRDGRLRVIFHAIPLIWERIRGGKGLARSF